MAKGEAFSVEYVPQVLRCVRDWLVTHGGRAVAEGEAYPNEFALRLAGSARRRAKQLHDVDIVVGVPDNADVPSAAWADRDMRFVSGGSKKQNWTAYGTLPIELYFTRHELLGAMLLYATGDAGFNIWMRQEAKKRGMKLSQWGLFRGEELVAAATERDIFRALDLPFVEPWRRAGVPAA